MSKIYVTSDYHFDHENIIRFSGRPFKDLVNMNSHMLDMWIRTVSEEDTIYFLGDFSFGPDSSDDKIVKYLSLLTGNVKFLLGNHDMPKPQFGSVGIERLIKDNKFGIEIIPAGHRIIVDNQEFELSHYRPKKWPPLDRNVVYLYGHVHSRFKYTNMHNSIASKKYDVGIDMYGGPVEITGDLRFINNPQGWRQ